MVSLQSWAQSDIGRKRAANEDTFYHEDTLGLFMVADGMGGHRGGDRASKLAVAEASATYKITIDNGRSITEALDSAVCDAAKKVHHMGTTNQELKGMGTTLSALAFSDREAFIAHIGDTRIYCFREGKLLQLTNDHSLVNEQVEAGLMTKEEARLSSLRNIITRAIGQDEFVLADYFTYSIENNDIFLLCTDGLNNMLSDVEIANILSKFNPSMAMEKLIAAANQKGGDDNITVVLVRVQC